MQGPQDPAKHQVTGGWRPKRWNQYPGVDLHSPGNSTIWGLYSGHARLLRCIIHPRRGLVKSSGGRAASEPICGEDLRWESEERLQRSKLQQWPSVSHFIRLPRCVPVALKNVRNKQRVCQMQILQICKTFPEHLPYGRPVNVNCFYLTLKLTWAEQCVENSEVVHILLINDCTFCIYLGSWKTAFQPENTSLQEFHVDEATTVMAPLMTHTGRYYYANDKVKTYICQRLLAAIWSETWKLLRESFLDSFVIILWPCRCGGAQLWSFLWANGPTCCWCCLTKGPSSMT